MILDFKIIFMVFMLRIDSRGVRVEEISYKVKNFRVIFDSFFFVIIVGFIYIFRFWVL